ncbi:hypothetical protein [Halarchaeum nitratireducens]|uniref:Uncharacterized protein n=1 Tax=Halarchaeum nitratireducens TaxID=489913 RepID=A0A830GCE9_9EURY|nr:MULTISPECIES: hypothetical protein [Halarchaeum]MBP2252191.1 hypothetical protein [Halarchaeum solikamskense]GGN18414.1 hypothetical protein GCM10009021_19210 [Halarchaeum nitratireducens]
MASVLTDVLTHLDAVVASLTILFPGFLTYFVYVGVRAVGYDRLKRGHVVLVLFFTLFFQIARGFSGGLMSWLPYQFLFYFVFPLVLGILADIGHRLFINVGVDWYQSYIVGRTERLEGLDVGNVSRWQKTVQSYVKDGLNDFTKEYYVEVEVPGVDGEVRTKRGFLNGYSDDDIEILRYDDLAEKSFAGVGSPDIDEERLTMTVELVPRDRIEAIRIYRVKMEDFELE